MWVSVALFTECYKFREVEVWNSHLLCCITLSYHMQETFQSQIIYPFLRIIWNATLPDYCCHLMLLHDAVKLPMFLLLHAKTLVAFHVSYFKICCLNSHAVSKGAWVFWCKGLGEYDRELKWSVDTALKTVRKSGKNADTPWNCLLIAVLKGLYKFARKTSKLVRHSKWKWQKN